MFLAIFSEEYSIGLSANDKTFIINNADDNDEATDIAEEYAELNNISYNCLDIIDLNYCKVIE